MNAHTAEQLLVSAAGHVLTAELIFEQQGEKTFDGPLSLSFYLLVGNALELMLKSAFISLGGDIAFAKLKIGHKLDLALKSAVEQGFASPGPELGNIVELLNIPHRTNYFRYMGGAAESFPLPTPAYSLSVLRRNIDQVARMIGTDALTPPPTYFRATS